ncbi:MAG: phosphoribosylamine--glycine ligase [Chloroflexota bacterium]
MSDLKVLVVGAGGREHALAWALSRSARVGQVFVAPGNAGTEWPENPNATGLQPRAASQNVAISAEDIPALLKFAQHERIDLTVVGPEVPLSMGIVDAFQAAGLLIFGPTKAAAQLESSKAFAKTFMKQHGIPTAEYGAFTNFETAHAFVHDFGKPVVVKADGLAAGKGVIVCDDAAQAEDALRRIMLNNEFGAAGGMVIVEERLEGEELSMLAFCDGTTAVMMPPARDHKRVFDNDEGPNTGGMGAFADVGLTSLHLRIEIFEKVIEPTLAAMQAEGIPYTGVLYSGIMLTPNGIKVLEFNCRFGDPETQVILPTLVDTDIALLLLACVKHKLDLFQDKVHWFHGAAASVALTSPGYPGDYPKGLPISGLEAVPEDVIVFHAGTTTKDGQVVTNGGRVLNVTAMGDTLEEAVNRAYAGVEKIHFEGMHHRKDIGRAGVKQNGQ